MKGRHPGQLGTSASVLIGRAGNRRHRLRLTIRRDEKIQSGGGEKLVVLAGQTWCGSQRFRSGWHSLLLDARTVNCERCLEQSFGDDAPAVDLLETGPSNKLTVKQGVTIDG